MSAAIDKYCKTHSSKENDIPSDFKEFLNSFQAKFEYVFKKPKDVDTVGYVKNRIVFYTTFNVKELLMFIDDVFKYRLLFSDDTFECLPCSPDVDVFAPPELQPIINKEVDDTYCKFSVVNEECPDMKLLH
eukprot:684385-Karenia_brevis.AAC.1